MSLKASILAVAGAVLVVAAPLGAHHAVSAEFDSSKPITIKGTIKRIEWTNPHIYTNVEVKEPDGMLVVYRVEGAAPNTLFRQGWRKEDLKIGEAVTVSGIRAKAAGSLNVGQATITTADGRKIYGQGAGGGARGPAPQ
ncbi:MAG: DUF6152 family protein [Acidobacteriota bacterium]